MTRHWQRQCERPVRRRIAAELQVLERARGPIAAIGRYPANTFSNEGLAEFFGLRGGRYLGRQPGYGFKAEVQFSNTVNACGTFLSTGIDRRKRFRSLVLEATAAPGGIWKSSCGAPA